MTYANLTKEVTINDWPIGRQRCKAHFWIESNKRGERACRETENKTRTGWNKAKKGTYSHKVRIGTAGNGRTYIISENIFGSFYIMRGDMKYFEESIDPDGFGSEGYQDLKPLMDAA